MHHPHHVFFFTEIELLNNETWRFIVENMGNLKVIELFVDPESKLGTNISQPRLRQTFASSSRDTPYEEHQRPSYSPNPTMHMHISPDSNSDADVDADADAFEFDITLDDISPFERVGHMISSDNTPIGNTYSDELTSFSSFFSLPLFLKCNKCL
jgi:hypothetical protein